WVSAVLPVADPDGAGPEQAETNHNVTDVAPGGSNTNWQFSRPQISFAATQYDDVIHVQFTDQFGTPINIDNTNDVISNAVGAAVALQNGSIWFNTGALRFGGTFTNAECTISTNGAGDLSEFYIQTAANERWNTDATGTGAGDADSSDRGRTGVAPEHRTSVPNISAMKGVLRAADGKTMMRAYGTDLLGAYTSFPAYTATTDETEPVLISVNAMRASHYRHDPNYAGPEAWDAHNYLHLRYSEPVDIGTAAAFQAAALTADNVRAQASFGAGEWGGHIADAAATVVVEGYLSYPGSFASDSRDGTAQVNSLYRSATMNPSGAHGLTVSIAGWSEISGGRHWPGYLDGVSDPAGQAVRTLPNALITDAAGNSIIDSAADTYDRYALTVTELAAAGNFNPAPTNATAVSLPGWDASAPAELEGWDVDPPSFSLYDRDVVLNQETSFFEIVASADPATNLVNSLDFHVLDNSSDLMDGVGGGWEPAADHPDVAEHQGLRDTSWASIYAPANAHLAFRLEQYSAPPRPALRNDKNTGLLTSVQNSLFSIGGIITGDDPYIRLEIDPNNHPWGIVTELMISYTQNEAYLTDLAGNLLDMPAGFSIMRGIEKTPPRIDMTVAPADSDRVFVRFSEAVFGFDAAPAPGNLRALDISDLTITRIDGAPSGVNITGLQVVRQGLPFGAIDSVIDAYLLLDREITAAEVFELQIEPAGADLVADVIKNTMLADRTKRISDIGIGVIEPVYAVDRIREIDPDSRTPAVTQFDGSQQMAPPRINLQARLADGVDVSLPVTMYWAVDAPANRRYGSAAQLWLPIVQPGFNAFPLGEAGSQTPLGRSNQLLTFRINDDELNDGRLLDILFRVDNLFAVRLLDSSDFLALAPWSVDLRNPVEQRAGVTILNNVINPDLGESTILQYRLEQSGNVTIQVFNLAGDLISVLHRGPQNVGLHTVTWNGTNMGGRSVARGIYFIRTVAPGIDEYRRVMIVK
ncbi:MAG: hypothetical protein D6B26_03675, partial [Spirochaetaceae bacterium]